jgi:hypothetical protein
MTSLCDRWLQGMESSDTGLLSLNNLYYDMKEKRLPPGLITQLLDSIEDGIDEQDFLVTKATDFLEKVIESDPLAYVAMGRPTINFAGSCSRVVPAHVAIRDNVDLRRAGWPAAEAYAVSDDDLRDLESRFGDVARGSIPADPPDPTRPRRRSNERAWVTQTAAIDALTLALGPDETLATAVRDALGLAYLQDSEKLVEIIYPPACMLPDKLAPPTFFDGSPYFVFRCSTRPDGWGETIDLSKQGRSLPEAVHGPTRVTSEFRLRYLLKTEGLKWNVIPSDIAGGCVHPWPAPMSRKELGQ